MDEEFDRLHRGTRVALVLTMFAALVILLVVMVWINR